ncbi:MAG TPA: AAA family ATPase [Candidatus Krumholzibacteria bacterium]|nr:AAA family ATPase [Candidatus Krumholzibacteria bacterium]
MRTLAVINQKGGCGKTTIAIHVSGALARLGKRVLLVDMDPQAHASLGLGIAGEDQRVTSYELLSDPHVTAMNATQEVQPGLWIIPSSTALSGIEQEFSREAGREERLVRKLARLQSDAFDVVVMDCPPGVGLLTFNALVAADEVLIPVDASLFSLNGLARLRETLDVIETELKHPFRVHVVCNNVDTRTNFSNHMLEEMSSRHAGSLLESFISNSVRLKEAAVRGVTIFDLDASSKPALQFLALARELTDRMPRIETRNMQAWMEQLHGPRRIAEGVLFTLDAPEASSVAVTGEFNDWQRGGEPLTRDAEDGLWKVVLDIPRGEYEYRFIVDGLWMRDPQNQDYVRNGFGQENSLLVV